MLKLNIQMFASQTFVGTLNGSTGHHAQFYVVRTYEQDETTNPTTTRETISLYIKKLSSVIQSYNMSAPYSIKEGNTTLKSGNCSFDIRYINVGASQLLASYSRTLQHNQDGTYPDYRLVATLNTNVSLGVGTVDKIISTPTINTSYGVAAQDLNISLNKSMPITVGIRENTGYTFDLGYEYSDLGGDIGLNLTSSPVLWTLSDNQIMEIKNLMSDTDKYPVIISCITKKDGVSIGSMTTSTVNFVITEKGILHEILTSESVSNIEELTNGEYIIKDLSKIHVDFNITPAIGSTINDYVVEVGDRKITSNTNNIILENISEHTNGVTTITAYCVDSRGIQTEKITQNIPFIDYIKSEFRNTECFVNRNSSDLDKVDVLLTANYFNGIIGVTNNTITLGYKYREKGTNTYISGNTPLTLNTEITLNETFDHTKTYEIVFTINDLIYTGSEMSKSIPSSQYIMLEHKTGVDFLNATILGKQIATKKEKIIVYEDEEGLALSTTIGTAQPFTGINLSEKDGDVYKKDYSNYKLNIHIGFTAPDGTKNNGIQIFSFDLANYETITGLNVHFMSGYSGGSTNDFFMIVANISNLNTTSWQWKPTSVKWFQSNNSTSVDTNLLKRMKLFKVELEEK